MSEPLDVLPPLPAPTLETNGDVFGHENEEGYRAAQMRSYGMECYRAGMEAAATMAKAFATCDCEGASGRCNINDQPNAIAAAISKEIP